MVEDVCSQDVYSAHFLVLSFALLTLVRFELLWEEKAGKSYNGPPDYVGDKEGLKNPGGQYQRKRQL